MNIYYLLMPAWVGLAGAAALRALMNVINPVLHVLVAVSPLLIPVLVRNRMNGPKSMNRTAIISLTLLVLGAGFFSLSVWLFRTKVFQSLYGGKYQESSIPLMFLLLSLLAACVVTVLSAGQMAMERPDGNFWSYVASSAVTILAGLPGLLPGGVSRGRRKDCFFLRASPRVRCIFFSCELSWREPVELKAATMPWDTVRLRIPFRFSGYSPILRVPKIGLKEVRFVSPLQFSSAARSQDQFDEE